MEDGEEPPGPKKDKIGKRAHRTPCHAAVTTTLKPGAFGPADREKKDHEGNVERGKEKEKETSRETKRRQRNQKTPSGHFTTPLVDYRHLIRKRGRESFFE